jgi:hypothetical protein
VCSRSGLQRARRQAPGKADHNPGVKASLSATACDPSTRNRIIDAYDDYLSILSPQDKPSRETKFLYWNAVATSIPTSGGSAKDSGTDDEDDGSWS